MTSIPCVLYGSPPHLPPLSFQLAEISLTTMWSPVSQHFSNGRWPKELAFIKLPQEDPGDTFALTKSKEKF